MTDRLERRERRRLRWRIGAFVLAVALPSGLLLEKALDQLKWEALRQTQLAAEALTLAIDEHLSALIRTQDRRSFAELAFLTVAGDPAAGFLQRSPLAAYPVEQVLPGLIGWFQIDADGGLSTPLLPAAGADAAALGIDAAELAGRQRLAQQIADILATNALAGRGEPAGRDDAEPADERAEAPPADALAERPAPAAAPQYRDDRPAAESPAAPAEYAASRSKSAAAEGQALFEQLFSRGQPQAQSAPLGGAEVARQAVREAPSALAPAPAGSLAQSAPSARTALAPAAEARRGVRREQAVLPEPMPAPAPKVAAAKTSLGAASRSAAGAGAAAETRRARADTVAVAPEALEPMAQTALPQPAQIEQARPVIRTFESELGPFRFDRLNSGHAVLYRWAWRDGARYVQGALVDTPAFLAGMLEAPFAASALARAVSLHVAWGEGAADGAAQPLAHFAAASAGYEALSRARVNDLPAGTVVYRARLTEPFGALQLRFDAARLPRPPGAAVIVWLGAVLALVLLAGGWMLYRLGQRQLALSRQQRDFIAAVSHELRTPLTAIRLYSEMLREGWAAEDKRPGYYRYIHDEAERLSRLVGNVLQLARMSRDGLRVEPRPIALSDLLAQARPTLANLAEQAGFALVLDCDAEADGDCEVRADPDAVTQVLINLVDNAIKFTGRDAPAQARRIEIRCAAAGPGAIIRVRDHGPGIPKRQRRRALALFQRLENEATRETRGTGIGLALVERLMRAMGGSVELADAAPGLEVRLRLPAGRPQRRGR
jgi:two-component system, OmpR family, phosphate regulon sensor histidine kinase PhoR